MGVDPLAGPMPDTSNNEDTIPPETNHLGCSGSAGYSITLKYEHGEKYSTLGILGPSEEDAARRGRMYLQNRITNERPDIDAFLEAWAQSIECEPPCRKVITRSEEPAYWADPVTVRDRVISYVRKTISIDVDCVEDV